MLKTSVIKRFDFTCKTLLFGGPNSFKDELISMEYLVIKPEDTSNNITSWDLQITVFYR